MNIEKVCWALVPHTDPFIIIYNYFKANWYLMHCCWLSQQWSAARDHLRSFHQFPADQETRQEWYICLYSSHNVSKHARRETISSIPNCVSLQSSPVADKHKSQNRKVSCDLVMCVSVDVLMNCCASKQYCKSSNVYYLRDALLKCGASCNTMRHPVCITCLSHICIVGKMSRVMLVAVWSWECPVWWLQHCICSFFPHDLQRSSVWGS